MERKMLTSSASLLTGQDPRASPGVQCKLSWFDFSRPNLRTEEFTGAVAEKAHGYESVSFDQTSAYKNG
jgi:hypothetical protein